MGDIRRRGYKVDLDYNSSYHIRSPLLACIHIVSSIDRFHNTNSRYYNTLCQPDTLAAAVLIALHHGSFGYTSSRAPQLDLVPAHRGQTRAIRSTLADNPARGLLLPTKTKSILSIEEFAMLSSISLTELTFVR